MYLIDISDTYAVIIFVSSDGCCCTEYGLLYFHSRYTLVICKSGICWVRPVFHSMCTRGSMVIAFTCKTNEHKEDGSNPA